MSIRPIPSPYRDEEVRHFEWEAQHTTPPIPRPEGEGEGEALPTPSDPATHVVEIIPPKPDKTNDEPPSFFV